MLKTKCSQCLGCNRLEEPEFKEIYRCANYEQGVEDE